MPPILTGPAADSGSGRRPEVRRYKLSPDPSGKGGGRQSPQRRTADGRRLGRAASRSGGESRRGSPRLRGTEHPVTGRRPAPRCSVPSTLGDPVMRGVTPSRSWHQGPDGRSVFGRRRRRRPTALLDALMVLVLRTASGRTIANAKAVAATARSSARIKPVSTRCAFLAAQVKPARRSADLENGRHYSRNTPIARGIREKDNATRDSSPGDTRKEPGLNLGCLSPLTFAQRESKWVFARRRDAVFVLAVGGPFLATTLDAV